MRLLVTGGAGFIGSNFARYWVEQHPEDHVVVYDVLTYAGNRPNLSDIEDRIVFVQGDICDPAAAEKGLRSEEIDTVVHFAAESTIRWPSSTRDCSSGPTSSAPRPCWRRPARSGWTASITSRPAKCTGTSPSTPPTSSRRTPPYRPRTPYNASKAGADHAVRAYAETYEFAGHDHQLRRQLRPVPVPRETDPAFLRAGPRR